MPKLIATTAVVLVSMLSDFTEEGCSDTCEVDVKALEHRGLVIRFRTCRGLEPCLLKRIQETQIQ